MVEEKEQKMQQKYFEFQMLEQQMKQVQEQLEKFQLQVAEINSIIESLEDFKKTKVDSEILVPIANGIFVKGKLLDNKEVVVNVGAGVSTKKTIDETQDLMRSQATEIEKYRVEITGQLNEMTKKGEVLEKELAGMM